MSIKKLFFLILLIVSVGRIAIAEDKKLEFAVLKAGQVAPFDGYIFTPESMSVIYSKMEEEIKLAKLAGEHNLELAQIDLQRVMDLNESERRIQAKLLQDTIIAKDEIIQNKIDFISKIQNSNSANKYWIVGGFIAGSALTFGIMYFTAGALK